MKESKYNFKLKVLGEDILYNAKSGALAKLEGEESKFIEGKISWDGLVKESRDGFIEGGFYTYDNYDELKDIKYSLMTSRYSRDSLSLTIALTADCNFRCIYCYEKENLKAAYMDDKTRENILKFIRNEVKNIENLNITWYGGEPLLGFSDLEYLTREIFKLRDEYHFNYYAFMVTNGYLLTRDIVKKLNELEVSGYQITIDGPEEFHNKKRFLKNGNGTFKKIIENLKNSIDILPDIALRVNVDRKNVDNIDPIIEIINSFDTYDKINIYTAKVENYNGNYLENSCLSDMEYREKEISFFKNTKNNILNKYPNRTYNFCGADYLNSYVLSQDGKVYKCWSDIGNKDKIVGELREGDIEITNKNYYLDLMTYDATEDEECRECKYLPLCMGGCPFDRINKTQKDCFDLRYDFNKYMEDISMELLGSE